MIVIDWKETKLKEKKMWLTPSVLEYIFTMTFECDYTIQLLIGRIYGGQMINSQSLYYFNPHISFWICRKLTNVNQNKYKDTFHY